MGAVGPIVRTRNSDDVRPTNWAMQAGSAKHDERYFYTSDFRGNVSAIVSSGGNLIEQYRYSATGVPFGIPHGDVNADGLVGTPAGGCGGGGGGGGVAVAAFTASSNADYDQTEYLMMNNTYEVRADWNLDGVIDPADAAVVAGMNGVSAGRKAMSAAGVGNRIAGEGTAELYDSAVVDIRGRVVSTKLQVVLTTADYLGAASRATITTIKSEISAGDVFKASSTMHQPVPVSDCAAYALLNPAKSDSPLCDEYTDKDSYAWANAKCFCKCAGDSAWSKFVRACLRCMYRSGVDSDTAHTICYYLGDRLAPGGAERPWGTLALCALQCWLHQIGTHIPDQTLNPDLTWPIYPDAP